MSQSESDLPQRVRIWSIAAERGQIVNYGDIHEIIHRDIKLGNAFRKERIKHMITLAGGVFALTVTFHKDLFGGHLTATTVWLVLLGWALLLISLIAGVFHFRAWENFYLAHRERGTAVWERKVADEITDKQEREKVTKRAQDSFAKAGRKIRKYRKWFDAWDIIQSLPLIVGMACIAAYVAISSTALLPANPSPSPALPNDSLTSRPPTAPTQPRSD